MYQKILLCDIFYNMKNDKIFINENNDYFLKILSKNYYLLNYFEKILEIPYVILFNDKNKPALFMFFKCDLLQLLIKEKL